MSAINLSAHNIVSITQRRKTLYQASNGQPFEIIEIVLTDGSDVTVTVSAFLKENGLSIVEAA